MPLQRSIRFALLLSTLAFAAGCSQLPPPKKTYTASGKVLLDGQPVRLGFVTLTPTTPGNGCLCNAATDANGVFTLRTYSNEEPDGAVPGEYKVAVESWSMNQCGPIPAGVTPTKVPAKYKSPDTSGVTITIKDEDANDLTVSLP